MKKFIHVWSRNIALFAAVVFGVVCYSVSYVGVYITYVLVPVILFFGFVAFSTMGSGSNEGDE